MLQAGVGGGPVDVAEVEQALTDQGGDLHVVRVEHAHGGGLGVGDHDAAVGQLVETGGLRPPGGDDRAVDQALLGGAGQDHQVAGDGVEGPDLVDAGHGDHRPVQHVRPAQVPRDRKSTRLNSSHVAISYAV